MAEVFKEFKYKNLNRFLDIEFIPRYIQMKRHKNKETNEIEVFPSVQLYNIVSLDYDEETLKHVLEYFDYVGVLVEGQDPKFFLANFDYVKDFKKNIMPKAHVDNDVEIFKQYLQTGDIKLRDAVIMKNIGIVKYIAYRFSKKTNLNMEEIESYGYEGLMQAVINYNPENNPKFVAYAYTCIKNAILNGIPKIYGFKAGDFYENFNRCKIEIENLNGETLEDNFSLIYDVVDLMLKNVNIYHKNETKNRVGLVYHESLSELDNQNVVDEEEPFELDLENEGLNENLYKVIENLPYKEQEVIKYLYGFKDGRTHTLEEVGQIFGVSRERIRTIQANALKQLRYPKNSKYIRVDNNSANHSLTSYSHDITYGHKL